MPARCLTAADDIMVRNVVVGGHRQVTQQMPEAWQALPLFRLANRQSAGGGQSGSGSKAGGAPKMTMDNWEKNPDGSDAINLVTGWTTAIWMKGMAGTLHIEYASDPAMKNRSAIRLTLAARQVIELRKALQLMESILAKELAATISRKMIRVSAREILRTA